ncbi:hypothetical protein IEC97_08100 [Neobacillus cucumis]|uniref:hypothetical protein n=1 Tax=Neobacillus cucumis TaxID=1740721 RepID=UPI0018E04906|nr:hypothetical protein [Neobacillus cucumis]MBI0577320.1 hypothetical protein [Neobacillus cucumis]
MLILKTLIGAEGARLLREQAGQVRPHRRLSAEDAHRPPRGKRASWSGNQQISLTEH